MLGIAQGVLNCIEHVLQAKLAVAKAEEWVDTAQDAAGKAQDAADKAQDFVITAHDSAKKAQEFSGVARASLQQILEIAESNLDTDTLRTIRRLVETAGLSEEGVFGS
jgi:hypothetical protein